MPLQGMAFFRKVALTFSATLACIAVITSPVYLIYVHTVRSTSRLAWLSWGFSDLLIDYRAGFVRRGLIGTVIHHFSGTGSELPVTDNLIFVNVCFCLVAITSLVLLRSESKIRNLILIFIIPGGLFAWGITNEFFYRKEAFFLTFLAIPALGLVVLRDRTSAYLQKSAALVLIAFIFVAGPVLTLVHEGFIFVSAAANVILLLAIARFVACDDQAHAAIGRRLALSYSAVIAVVFLIACYFRGGEDVASAIWRTLNPADRAMISPDGIMYGGIGAIASSFWTLIRMPLHVFISGLAWFWLVPLLGLMFYSLTIVDLNLTGEHHERIQSLKGWGMIYGFLFVCLLPAFLLGWDWGRWIASLNLSFLILWLSVPESELPGHVRALAPALNPGACSRDLGTAIIAEYDSLVHTKTPWVVAFLILFAITFRLPEATLQPIDTQYVLHHAIQALKMTVKGGAFARH
jgi:hypothetical protein